MATSKKTANKPDIACNSVSRPESILGRTVCLSLHPGKLILAPLHHWFHKRYKGKYKFAKLLFSFDLLLIGTLIGLALAILFFGFHPSTTFEDHIIFEATVAPREISTGAPSTLVIHYTNNSEEELRNAELHLTFPDHFLLQELTHNEMNITNDTIHLGSIPAGDTGSVHIQGVMFGDVGGEQSFTSTLTFVHGDEKDIRAKKTSIHTFSPSVSTLKLALTLPEHLVASQEVEGTITYQNTGNVDFPQISIDPKWPDGFTLLSSNAHLIDGTFTLPAIEAGTSGEFTFLGRLSDVDGDVDFIFLPSFTFDTSQYKQKTLSHTATVIPPQVRINHSVTKNTVQPGASTTFTLSYTNTGDFPVSNLILSIESDSPFFRTNHYDAPIIAHLEPDQTGELEILVPLRSSILQSETSSYENLDLVSRAKAIYTLGDGTGQRVSSKDLPLSSPIITPVVLQSFGRYATAGGDQLGRGPLPPRVGIETKYWVFWHVGGTINELQNAKIEGTLGRNVQFTGKQSTSQNNGVTFDPTTNTINWETSSIEPSLSPSSKIVGVAFELALTPDEAMQGKAPVLLQDIQVTGTDARTGAFVSASGPVVSTNLPQDLMASGKALVED